MKHFKILITIIILLQGLNIKLNAQHVFRLDSIEISRITLEFFDWYINAIEQGAEFQPRFAESKNGMTTLDFTKYFENLKKFNFSDLLIAKEKKSYKKCLGNLARIKYSDFDTKINDLSAFEQIQCDFGNYYRWTGGQENCAGVQISSLIFSKKNNCIVNVEKFGVTETDKKNVWGLVKVKLVRQNNRWIIDDIGWK
jgi:hypothetical protein